jgi:hypothetical protein
MSGSSRFPKRSTLTRKATGGGTTFGRVSSAGNLAGGLTSSRSAIPGDDWANLGRLHPPPMIRPSRTLARPGAPQPAIRHRHVRQERRSRVARLPDRATSAVGDVNHSIAESGPPGLRQGRTPGSPRRRGARLVPNQEEAMDLTPRRNILDRCVQSGMAHFMS